MVSNPLFKTMHTAPNNTPIFNPVRALQVKQNGPSAKTLRNRRRRQARAARRNQNQQTPPMSVSQPYVPMIPPSMSHGNSMAVKQLNQGFKNALRREKLTSDGVSFLKCAFAPPDFAVNKLAGVPDTYEGNSLVKKHRLIAPEAFTSGRDYYIWLAPVPGVAYMVLQVASGAPVTSIDTWTVHRYSDYNSMFGTNATGSDSANKVTQFRFVSNHIEMVPTVNQMQWSGSIQAFKVPAQIGVRTKPGMSAEDCYSVTGLEAVNSTNSNQFCGPFFNGVYAGCFSANCKFDFQRVVEGMGPAIPLTVDPVGDFTQIAGRIPGMDNGFESLIVKVSGLTTNCTAILKTWACVEYQVQANNDLYEYQTASSVDPVAMDVYKKLVSELPIGVGFMDNESFWRRVLQLIKGISGGLSFVPGPYGLVAQGVNTITNGIDQLL